MTSSDTPRLAPCGAWPSTISAAMVAAGATPLSQLGLDGQDICWLAGRAAEGGRNTLLRWRPTGGATTEMTPAPFNVRTRVHEYGGGACLLASGVLTFSHFADNRLYRITGDGEAQALTAAAHQRHADFVLDAKRGRLISVREQHRPDGGGYPDNCLCAISADGEESVLVQGSDFYAAPRVSPDGARLAWLSWDHPRMPWQGTELWCAELHADGSLGQAQLIAGSSSEAVCQPEWSPQGELHFVSDRSGWWNLYRWRGEQAQALCPMAAEFGAPHWQFGGSMYGFDGQGGIVCTYIEGGVSKLGWLRAGSSSLEQIAVPYDEIRELRVGPGFVALLGGAPTLALEVARIDLASGQRQVLARSVEQLPPPGMLSVPRAIDFPSAGGSVAHAFFYAPKNEEYMAAAGDLPPLIVIIHGGPTGMATSTLKLSIQYWTSRGFAVLDVNYRGSSGFGRAYRDALQGQWGVADVEDCVAGARNLVERGEADGERLLIRGGSAGGFTTLCALIFHDVFKGGASYYGVSDLKGLDADSHKFESHYNEYLIAPAAQADAVYRERSPIHHSDRLTRPMIFFQGLDDKVVPPQQSDVMVAALKARGVPVAYLQLEGEGHGFRKAESTVRTLEAERYFYLRIFGLQAPDALPPVAIDNLPD